MAEITAQAVKELREKSGAGMMDCKKALTENNGDIEASIDWLRKKGIVTAGKKAGRVAAEGLVAVASTDDGKEASIVEINSETDFVAKNADFQKEVINIARIALFKTSGKREEVCEATCNTQKISVNDIVTNLIAKIGENITFRKSDKLKVSEGVVATYVHNQAIPNAGKIGVLVALESKAPKEKLLELGRQIAMHIAAAKPEALARDEVSSENLDRERQIFIDQARASGKPDNVIEKMVDGRINKFYGEVVLPEQIFVIDGKSKVSEYVDAVAKEAGAPIKITGFKLYILGEGIEKEQKDFATEVAEAAKGAA